MVYFKSSTVNTLSWLATGLFMEETFSICNLVPCMRSECLNPSQNLICYVRLAWRVLQLKILTKIVTILAMFFKPSWLPELPLTYWLRTGNPQLMYHIIACRYSPQKPKVLKQQNQNIATIWKFRTWTCI